MLEFAVSTFVTFFIIIDPIGTAPLFLAFTNHLEADDRRKAAIRSAIIAAGILLFFGLVGGVFLRSLGITLAAFRTAGGLLLLLLAIDMVLVRHSGLRTTTDEEDEEAQTRDDVSVFPLAIPTIAGPGAITSVVLIMGAHAGNLAYQGIIIALMVGVVGLTLLAFLAAGRLMKILGETGINVVTRVLGIVLAAIAVQFIGDGLRELLFSGR